MKKYSPNLLKKSIGTQTERSPFGTQRELCETILYPLENSTSDILTIRNEIDVYNKPLCKINSSPQICLKLTPQKKSFHSNYFDYIRGVQQSDRGSKNSMLTADDDFHEVKEDNFATLVEDGSNETKEQKKCILSAVGHSSHEVVIQENCAFPIIDDKIIHVDQNDLISANSEGNNKSSQQENCMSLAFDDKLKPVGQKSSMSANNEVNSMSANNEVNSKSSEQKNCILPAVDNSNREVVLQKNLISPVIGYKSTRIENNNLFSANTGEREYCMSLFIDEIPESLDKDDSISGNSKGNNKFNEQDNHMSLVIDDKIKPVGQKSSMSANNEVNSKSSEQKNCILPAVDNSNREVVLQKNLISPVIGYKSTRIENNNLISANTGEREYCMSLFIDEIPESLDKDDSISGNSKGNNKFNEQDNHMSLVIDDKIKSVDRNNSISENNGRDKSCEQESCIEDYVPIWKYNPTPRQCRKTRNAGLSKIVNADGSSADNEVCVSSVINDKPKPVDQNNSISTINEEKNKSSELDSCIHNCELICNKNTTPRQYNKSRGSCFSKRGSAVSNNDNYKSREWMNLIEYCEPMWKKNTTPRQYKSPRGTDLIKIGTSVGNTTKCFEKNNEINNFSTKKEIETNALKNLVSIPTSNHDSTGSTAVQSIPAHGIEPLTLKTADNISPSNHSIKDALSSPDHSNFDISLKAVKSLTSVSQKFNVFIVKVMSDKADKNVITIDMRIYTPNRFGKKYEKGEEFNEIITKPKVDFNVIKPNYSVKPKRVFIRPNANGKYVCSNCGKIYNLKGSFVQHTRRKCQKSYPCVWCTTEFKTKGELNFHNKRGCNPRPVSRKAKGAKERIDKLCEYCGREFSNKTSFYHHLQGHLNGKCHLCTTCGKRFTKRSTLRSHERCVHTKEKPWYNCTRCPHRSRLRKHVVAHEKIHDLPEGAEVPTPFRCHCGQGFISSHMLTVHKNTHHKPKKCNMCGDILGNSKFLSIHKLSAHNVSSLGKLNSDGTSTQTCPICAESFVGHCCKIKLDKHLDVVHDIAIGPGVRLSCDICSYTFTLFASYILHKSTLHKVEVTESDLKSVIQRLSVEGENRSAESSQPMGETRIAENNQPMIEFRSAESSQPMIETRSAESSQPTLETRSAESSYPMRVKSAKSSNVGYSKNVKNTEGRQAKVKKPITPPNCPICAKTFLAMTSLDYHLEVKHDIGNIGSGEFLQCSLCRKTFKSFASYIYHTSSIHEKEVDESQMTSMKEHLAWYKGDGIVKCEHCDRKYLTRRKLSIHTSLKHPTGSGFSCEACNIHFETRSDFYNHKYSDVHLPTEKVSCNVCHKKFKNPKCLWAHKIVHATKPRICCFDCGSKFKRKGDYMKHRRKHEPDKDSN